MGELGKTIVFVYLDTVYMEIIGDPVTFQVNYSTVRNLANHALEVALSISESMSGAVVYNVMNLNATRVATSGCVPGRRRRRRRSIDLSKYVNFLENNIEAMQIVLFY